MEHIILGLSGVLIVFGIAIRSFYLGTFAIVLAELAMFMYIELPPAQIGALGGIAFILKMLAAHDLHKLSMLEKAPAFHSVPSIKASRGADCE